MEKEGHTVTCSTDISRPKDGSDNLVPSPHRSRRLEERAKALNKCRLSLEDLLSNVDKRNEKFGYVVTNIGSASKSLISSDSDQRTCKKGYMSTIGSNVSLLEHSYTNKSLFSDQKVVSQSYATNISERTLSCRVTRQSNLKLEGVKEMPKSQRIRKPAQKRLVRSISCANLSEMLRLDAGNSHNQKRRDPNFNERTLSCRVTRQSNPKSEFVEGVKEIHISQRIREPAQKKLVRSESYANLSEMLRLDAGNSHNQNPFKTAISEGSSEKIESGDKAHPSNEVETASTTSVGRSDSQGKEGHSSKEDSNQGLVASSVCQSGTTTEYETNNFLSTDCSANDEGNSLPPQNYEEHARVLTTASVCESELANESVAESKVISDSLQVPPLLTEKSKCSNDISSPDDDNIMIEQNDTQSSQETYSANPTKIELSNSEDSFTVKKDEECSTALVTEKSVEEMKQTKSYQEDKADNSEQQINKSPFTPGCIVVSPSTSCFLISSLYSDNQSRHVRLGRSGVTIINVVKSDSILTQGKEKSSLEAAVVNNVGNAVVGNQFSSEVLATAAQMLVRDEEDKASVGKVGISEEGKQTRIFTPTILKKKFFLALNKEEESSKSPKVLSLEAMPRSKGDSSTNSGNTQKNSPEKNRIKHPRKTVGNVVRNIFEDEIMSIEVDLVSKVATLVNSVDHEKPSVGDRENLSKEVSEVVEKLTEDELQGSSHPSPNNLWLSDSSEADGELTSDPKFISSIEIPSVSPREGNKEESLVLDTDKDLEKCEDDILSRGNKKESLVFDTDKDLEKCEDDILSRGNKKESLVFDTDEDLEKCEDDILSRGNKKESLVFDTDEDLEKCEDDILSRGNKKESLVFDTDKDLEKCEDDILSRGNKKESLVFDTDEDLEKCEDDILSRGNKKESLVFDTDKDLEKCEDDILSRGNKKESLVFDTDKDLEKCADDVLSRENKKESLVFVSDEDSEKCDDDVLSRHQKGDYSCGFIGFKDDSLISCSRDEPFVVLERLPSWIVKNQTVKLMHDASPVKKTAQDWIDTTISPDELLYRKDNFTLKRKYKSMSDLTELIHDDLQKERDFMTDRRRITRSFGEEIKVDYLARLPDERDFKLKKPENNESMPFFGFNIPYGFLGLPDHYLVYKSIINKCKQRGFHVDPNLGAGNLDEKSESLYFMGDCNPFRARPMMSQIEREKLSPTKILEIASVNRSCHSQTSVSPQRFNSESNDTFFITSPVKIQEMKNLTVEFEQAQSTHSITLSKVLTPGHSPSSCSDSAVDSNLQNSKNTNGAEDRINNKQTVSEGSACGKTFCRLGCLCESLKVQERVKLHCGHEGCMFSSTCCKTSSRLPIGRTKVSILEHIDVSSSEEELVRSKRKRKIPARLLQEEIICSPVYLGSKKLCHNSNILSLNEEMPSKLMECRVVLNRFHLSGASVRCLYHFRRNCPCLKDKLLEIPRNVAMKSTSGRLQLNSQFIVGHSQTYPGRRNLRILGTKPVFGTPGSGPLENPSPSFQSTIIYPQYPSNGNGSNSASSGDIASADSLVMSEDLNRGGTRRHFFNSMGEFQLTLSQRGMKCSDLEKICSESINYLPKGALQIMKLSFLKEMLQTELAFLWMMSLQRGRAHVFLTKENKAPGVACQRVRNLDELNKLPPNVKALFASCEKNNDHLVSCIQISQSYFWQIAGTISFVKNDNSNSAKTGSVVTNISDSKPLWSASPQKKGTPKGFQPVNFTPLGSGNGNADNASRGVKKLKVIRPINSALFRLPHSPEATVSLPSSSSILRNPTNTLYRVWYELGLNRPFTELHVKSKNFMITRTKLQELYSLARAKKSFVKLSFSGAKPQPGKPHPGILVYPKDKKYSVKIGPFPLNKPTGVKTFKRVDGLMIETLSYLTINRVIAREKKIQQQHNAKGTVYSERKWKLNVGEGEATQNVNKPREVANVVNPKVAEIVSTEDADPDISIVIQDVQGHYDTFNDIPSPIKSSAPYRGESDAQESWRSDNEVSYLGELHMNDSEITHKNVSDANNTVDSFESEEPRTAAKDNLESNYFKMPNEIMLNHNELILKEEPDSDPLDEQDPLAPSSEENLPDPLEITDQCDLSVADGAKDTVGGHVRSVQNYSLSPVQKISNINEKSIFRELKQGRSSLSKRSLLKKNNLPLKAGKLPQSLPDPIKIHGNVETGYLVPDVPGIQPIPVARGGMTDLESKAITMKNPMSKDGKLIHILDLPLANLFLNEAALKRVNFFPNDMRIKWTFVRVAGMASQENLDGLMHLGDLTNNMFITAKGVFSYDDAVQSKAVLQRCGICPANSHRFMEAKRRRQIINIQKHLADLIQMGSKANTLIATIKYAQEEIEKLKSESVELENQIYLERCIKTNLMSRMRRVASNKEMEAVLESLESLKRETVAVPMEPIVEIVHDSEELEVPSWRIPPRPSYGRSRKRPANPKRLSPGDDSWTPGGLKRNKRVRQKEDNGSELEQKLSPVKNPLLLKPKPNTAFSLKYKRQLNMLKKYIISSNSYRSKGLGSTSQTGSYSFLNNTQSVLAAADAETSCSSPLDNEESILSSGSEVDIETFEDDIKVID